MCSAALIVFDCGAFTTITPRRVAASTSTLSTPMPARATTFRSGAASRTSAVTRVALRITSASYAAIAPRQVAAREILAHVDLEPFAEQIQTRLGELLGDEHPHPEAAASWKTPSADATAAPRFTGWPSRSRVISRAASPRTMSSSLK